MAANSDILVADSYNRLLLLNSSLEFMDEFQLFKPRDHGVIDKRLRKMLLDEADRRLFVAAKIWKASDKRNAKT